MNDKLKFYLPTIITVVLTFFLTIAAETWAFDGITIFANLFLIGMFSGIVFLISLFCNIHKKHKQEKLELIKAEKIKQEERIRLEEDKKKQEIEKVRIAKEEEQRRYDEWFNSLSEAEKQTELQKQYYEKQLKLEKEKLELEKKKLDIQNKISSEQNNTTDAINNAGAKISKTIYDTSHKGKRCPKCGSNDTVANVRMKTTLNLNPLKPFTITNHKPTKKSYWICQHCGRTFK